MTKKVLIAWFDPFNWENINSSFKSIKLLPNNIWNAKIIKIEIPTVFWKSFNVLKKFIEEEKPDIVICVWQGGSSNINVERIAINIDDASIKDNEWNKPIDSKICFDWSDAHFSSLPIKYIVKKIKEAGISSCVSNSAWTFVCNHIMYNLLNYINKWSLNIKWWFIHVPCLPEQVLNNKWKAYMKIEDISKALYIAIETSLN